MINIADILKDCPNGTKLYSPICGECRLIKIYDSLGFDVINDTDEVFNFSYDGRFNLNGECCIFPSKENRDWNTFQKPFKDGDIIYKPDIQAISILKSNDSEKTISYAFLNISNILYTDYRHNSDLSYWRIATEEEENRLFDAIKSNGYKWNAETKTLEKLIVPKFKVGDKITNGKITFKIGHIDGDYYGLTLPNRTGIAVLNVYEQDEWELAPTPKFKIGDIIKYKKHDIKYRIINEENDMYIVERCTDNFTCHMSFKYVDDEYELVPNKFDISTLKPYDKVLVRDDNNSAWINTFFGFCDTVTDIVTNKKYPFIAGSVNWAQCIPYEGNEHLLGKCDDCDEYYKNW